MIKIYNRKTKRIIYEEQYGGNALDYLYNTIMGRILLKIVINPFFSKVYGLYSKSIFSKNKIKKLISKYNIDLSKYENVDYKSYNEFFTRKMKTIKINEDEKAFISPAEAKLICYKITNDLKVNIKGSIYDLEELLDEKIDESFINGNCLIFRLSMDNYHRYCFIDEGIYIDQKSINGKLHTVSSISSRYKIYKENKRVVNKINLKNIGMVYQIEVGALLVGTIDNESVLEFKRGMEKGHFEIGGSTIIVLTRNNIAIDNDIIKNSHEGIETLVDYGEKVGVVHD